MPIADYFGAVDPSQLTEEQLMNLQNPQYTDTGGEPILLTDYIAPTVVADMPAPKAAEAAPSKFDESGVNALQDYIQNLKEQKQAVDYTPLAAYLDSTFGGNLTEAAKAMRGMSKEDKAFKLGALQNELAQRKNEINKNEAASKNAETAAATSAALLGLRKQAIDNQGLRVGNVQDKILQIYLIKATQF
jgi:hypothetical protein